MCSKYTCDFSVLESLDRAWPGHHCDLLKLCLVAVITISILSLLLMGIESPHATLHYLSPPPV